MDFNKPKISIIILILIIFNIFIYVELDYADAAIDDQNLFGMIYKSDGTALSEDFVNSNITEFCIWLSHNSNWMRYPTSGWELTNGGWYSYVLPESDKGTTWDNGDLYMLQVNGEQWGELNTNCTSYGAGSTDVTGIPGEGANEFTPRDTPYNILNMADTSNPSVPDNIQQWDVVTNNIDLVPANITINGILYPGPYTQPIGPIIVDLNSTSNISAKVGNLGSPGLIKTSTLTIIDESNNDQVLNSGAIDSIGAHTTAPPDGIKAQWHASSTSGDYYVKITVDCQDNITETDETNNFVQVIFSVKSIDLIPWNVNVNGIEYTSPRTISMGVDVYISAQVKNVGTLIIDKTFTLTITDEDSNTLDYVEVERLGPDEVSTELVEYDWTSDTPGTYVFNVTVDWPENIIQEFNEVNNNFTIKILVEGPDLVPWNVKVNSIPYKSSRTVSLDSTVTFSAKAKNIGYLDVTEKFGLRLVKGKSEVISEVGMEGLGVDEVSTDTLTYEWTPDVLGRNTFNVTVDLPKSNILEFNENNNRFYIELFVVGKLTVDIIKSVDKNKANPGDELSYEIFFNNTGDYTISLIKINDTLPEGVIYVDDNADQNSGFISRFITGNLVMYEFNNINPGSHSFVIEATINTSVIGGTELENWVTMDYQDEDGNLLTGLIGYARTIVMAPKLKLIKYIDKPLAGPNDILTYTIYFNNTGDTNSATVRITDILPEGLNYVADTSSNLSSFSDMSINGSSLEFVFVEVEVGEYYFTITVKVDSNITDNISLVNWAILNYTDTRGNELRGSKGNASVNIEASNEILILFWPSVKVEKEVNYKPLIALLFCLVLITFSLVSGYERPLRIINRKLTDEDMAKLILETRLRLLNLDRFYTCLILALPIPLLEGIIGIISFYTEFLKVPPWWGAGMVVNLIIFIVGIIFNIIVILKGQCEVIKEEDI